MLHQVVLEGVRCPATGDAYARKARMFTTRAVFAREVKVTVWGVDSSGRLVADVHGSDGLFLNAALVKAGLAWATGGVLKRIEEEARAGSRGMWNLADN